MPFHIDKFKSSPGVRAMHPAARSGYLYLIAYAWQTEDCSIPSDPIELAEISELGDELWETYGTRILRKFYTVEATGRLQNEVCFKEWREAKEKFEANSRAKAQAGRRGADARWKDGKAMARAIKNDGKKCHTGTGTLTGTETEGKAIGLTPLSAEPTLRPEEFANVWNRNRAHLPKVERFTESRRKKVRARIAEGITLERFQEAVECCRGKPFLRGDNDRGWTADFDWLIENDKNIEKAITKPYGGCDGQGKNHRSAEDNGGIPRVKTGSAYFDGLLEPLEPV